MTAIAHRLTLTTGYGWLLAILTTMLFSIGPPAAKVALNEGFSSVNLLLVRYLLATSLMVLTIALSSARLFFVERKGLLICIGAGLVITLTLQTFTLALTRMNASIASIIVALYPLVVLLILALRGEKFTYRNTVRVAMGLSGIYLLIGPGGQVDFIGTLLVISTCLTFALYLVIIQWYLKEYPPRTIAVYVLITIMVANIGIWLGQGGGQPEASGWGWLAVLVIGVGTYLGQLMLYQAVRLIGSGQMALLNPVEILMTVMWATLFLQERLSLLQWIGGSLILCSMLLAIKRISRADQIRWRPRLRFRL